MNFVWYPNEVSSHFLNPHTLKSLFHSLTFSVDTLSGVRWGNQPFSRLRETSCTSSPIAPTEDLPGGFGLTEKVAHATALDFLACHRGDDRASGNNTSFLATRARKTCNTRDSSCFLFRERKKNLVCFERICDRHRLKQLVIKPESSKTVVSTARSTVAEWKVEDFPGALITCHFYNTHNDTRTYKYICMHNRMYVRGGREIKKTKSVIRWGTADDDGDDALEKAVAVSVESPSYGAVETSIDQVSIHPQRKLECEKTPR